MPQKTQAATISVASATGTPKTITAITAAAPPVCTSAAHGFANGTVLLITAVVGMTQLNNRAFIVANTAANTFELKGVDGTGYTAYVSGGTATPQTMTAVGEVRSITLYDGEASEIDTTSLASTAKEFFIGLQDFGNNQMTVFMPSPNDTGQTRLRALKASASSAAFLVTLASAQTSAFVAFVKSFAVQEMGPDSVAMATINLRNANEPSFFS